MMNIQVKKAESVFFICVESESRLVCLCFVVFGKIQTSVQIRSSLKIKARDYREGGLNVFFIEAKHLSQM